MAVALQREGDDLLLVIHAQPGAKQSAFAGLHGDALKVRLAAPALEGRANRELCRFLAGEFGVATADIEVVFGRMNVNKQLRIHSLARLPSIIARPEVR